MPSSDEILSGLTATANHAFVAAIGWHIALALVLVALAAGWHPSRRTAAASIASLLASVSGFAFSFGNPFNGLLFAAGAVALLVLALIGDAQLVGRGPSWAWWAGVAMIALGWVYPHFLTKHPATYLFAAPLGLVPCPTLSVALGLALLSGGLGSRAWRVVLAALGMFYGLFGVFRLGVALDAGLVGGAVALGATVPLRRAQLPKRYR